jgi:lipoprotein-anchoring transpeptidase ErfK/SrfK
MRLTRCVVAVALAVSAGCGVDARARDDAAPATEDPALAALRPLAEVPSAAPEEVPALTRPVAPSPTPTARPARKLAPQYDALAAPVVDWFGDRSTCPATGRGAVVDRANQMAWLCGDGAIVREFPVSTARSQPDPGTYPVYDKDLNASSTISGAFSRMTHFVAFTHGKYQGARIAFHSVPTYGDGSFVQPLESVGTADWWGDSAGCIRVLPDDAVAIWDWLAVGDTVNVIS